MLQKVKSKRANVQLCSRLKKLWKKLSASIQFCLHLKNRERNWAYSRFTKVKPRSANIQHCLRLKNLEMELTAGLRWGRGEGRHSESKLEFGWLSLPVTKVKPRSASIQLCSRIKKLKNKWSLPQVYVEVKGRVDMGKPNRNLVD